MLYQTGLNGFMKGEKTLTGYILDHAGRFLRNIEARNNVLSKVVIIAIKRYGI